MLIWVHPLPAEILQIRMSEQARQYTRRGLPFREVMPEIIFLPSLHPSANITPASITISGVTANNKIYNGTAAATLNFGSATLTGLFSGDAVTINSGSATAAFSDKNAGNAKPVTISGITLSGADAANYTYTQPTTSANITPLPLTIAGITGNSKLYDRTIAASINTAGAITLRYHIRRYSHTGHFRSLRNFCQQECRNGQNNYNFGVYPCRNRSGKLFCDPADNDCKHNSCYHYNFGNCSQQ